MSHQDHCISEKESPTKKDCDKCQQEHECYFRTRDDYDEMEIYDNEDFK